MVWQYAWPGISNTANNLVYLDIILIGDFRESSLILNLKTKRKMKSTLIALFCIACIFGVSNAQVDTLSYNIYQQDGNLGIGRAPWDMYMGLLISTPNATVRLEDTDQTAGDAYNLVNNTKGNDVLNFAVYNKTDERAELSFDGNGNIAVLNGKTGFGTASPKTKVQVANGDIYISDINYGIIMKSPDGRCWKGTIDNYGQLNFLLLYECPDVTTTAVGDVASSSKAEVSVYPNPARDQISVEVSNVLSVSLNLSITDHIGREVESMYLTQKKNNIWISHLPVGVYYVNISGNNFNHTEKIVKH